MNKRSFNQDDEDDDYMSDKFLNEAESTKSSLLFNHRMKHDHQSFKKKKQHELKPRKVLERETLEQGLNKPIDQTNKGFKLLVKMGFKSDEQSTSKDQKMFQSPIAITIKQNRIGLGGEKKERKTTSKIEDFEDKKKDFVDHIKMKNQMRLAKGDLMKCQMACHKFDNESNKKPFKDWFWPKFDVNDQESDDCETEEEEEKEEETIMEKLILINDYLRKEYCYCVWCGVKFDSDEDMQDECPGNDRYSHF